MWPLMRDKLVVPQPQECLPGRAERMKVPERHFVNGHPLAGSYPAGFEKAVFGLGCFWGAERVFWQAPGVWVTAVGYAGGSTPNPTYEEVCSGRTGHTEAVLVVYDPVITSYDALLRLFWESHDPTQGMRQGNDVGTQYRSAIYTYSPEQRRLAETDARRLPAAAGGGPLRRDLDRDRRCPAILFRRGLPPAIPRQKPARLLRARRHRRRLPDPGESRRRLKRVASGLVRHRGTGPAERQARQNAPARFSRRKRSCSFASARRRARSCSSSSWPPASAIGSACSALLPSSMTRP